MKSLVLVLFISLSPAGFQAQTDQSFSAAELKTDLLFLQTKLQELHPNLYTHSTPEEIEHYFNEAIAQLPESQSPIEAYRVISGISTVLKDGHTLFNPPAGFLGQQKAYFPFKVFWNGTALFIERNFSDKPEIEKGSVISSINGLASSELIEIMLAGMMRDGDNLNYPVWVINMFFTAYYSYFFGHQESFDLDLISPSGERYQTQVEAKTFSGISEARRMLYPGQDVLSMPEGRGIHLEYDEYSSTAILTIPDFHPSILKAYYGQKFPKIIKSIFNEINDLEPDKLILDLRHNQGGSIRFGRILLSYLMDQPFQMVEAYNKPGKKKTELEADRLRPARGPQMGLFEPKENAFQGELIVLINGGSFSNSGIVSNVLKKYARATFVGEETGGNCSVLSGNAKSIKLPNTGILVDIPTLQFVLNTKKLNHGVIPDIPVRIEIADLISNKDVVLEKALLPKK